MKPVIRILILLTFIVLFNSCKGDEETNTIEVNSAQIEIDGANDKSVIVFTSSAGKWSAISSEDWCKLSPVSGETKMGSITVTADTNMTFAIRKALVTISAPGAEDVEVTVLQGIPEDLNLISISEADVNVKAEESTFNFTLQSSTNNWSVSSSPDWATISPASGETGAYDLTVTVAENTGISRSGSITFTGNSTNDVSLKIKQERASYPDYSNPIAADQTGVGKNAIELASEIYLGWNLGNTLEVPNNETAWGNPKTTQALIDAVKDAGFNAVRLPCAWDSYIENRVTCKIKDWWLNRVQEVVDYCINNDMYVIINIHWDGGWLEENPIYSKQDAVNAKQKALWEQIAVHFRDYDEHLLFAGTNEVHENYSAPSNENIEVQESYNQTFVDAVRSTGGKNAYRNLIVQAYNTNIDHAYNKMTMPDDVAKDRLMAEVHYYDPWGFCGASSDDNSAVFFWGKEAGYSNVSEWGQEDHVRSQYFKMKSKFVDEGIPVIMGEYGAFNRTKALSDEDEKLLHQQSRAYYLQYTTRKMKENGIVPFFWDNGYTGKDGFGIINRNTKNVYDQKAMDALIEGANAGVYPF